MNCPQIPAGDYYNFIRICLHWVKRGSGKEKYSTKHGAHSAKLITMPWTG